MAVLEKMREKSGSIFMGLIVAFLLMIVFEWGAQGDFFRSGRTGNEIGEVNGYKITSGEYDQVYQQVRQQKLAQTKKKSLTEAEENEVREDAWNQLIINKLIEQKIEEYNISITDQEVRDLVYYNPPSFLKQGFVDSTGRFMEQEYFQAIRDPRNDTIISSYIEPLRDEMRRIKLQGFLQALSRVTNQEMWDRYDIQNSKAVVQVVKIKPTSDESQFISKVTDDEVKKYYDDHQYEFKRDEAKKIKFVLFREAPTAKDSALLVDRFETLRKRWSALPLNEADSIVAELAADYSEEPYAGIQPFNITAQRGVFNSGDVLKANVGDIVMLRGQGQLSAVRVFSILDTGSVMFNVRHILIKKGQGISSDSGRAIAQQLYTQIQGGANFAELARQYSADGSAQTGGDIGWASKGMLVPEFEKVCLSAPIRQVQGPVETQYGYHIIEVLDRTAKTVNVGMISMPVKTSSQTANILRQQARLFRDKADKNGFDAAAKEMNLRIISDAPAISKSSQPIFNNTAFVRYILTLSNGDISEPVKVEAVKGTVVAQVVETIAKGVSPLDDNIKQGIKMKLAKRKMVEALAPKAQQLRSLVGSGEGLDKIAASDTNFKPVMLTFGPAESVSGLGTEYAVNTAAFKMQPGEVSQPIKGDNGYYIVQLVALNPASKQTFETQKTQFYQNLNQEKQQRFFSEWFEKLKDEASIKDYRTLSR